MSWMIVSRVYEPNVRHAFCRQNQQLTIEPAQNITEIFTLIKTQVRHNSFLFRFDHLHAKEQLMAIAFLVL